MFSWRGGWERKKSGYKAGAPNPHALVATCLVAYCDFANRYMPALFLSRKFRKPFRQRDLTSVRSFGQRASIEFIDWRYPRVRDTAQVKQGRHTVIRSIACSAVDED